MSRAALLLIVPLVVGCSKKDDAPPVDTAAAVAAVPAPVAATPAPMDVAGTYSVAVMAADKDTTLLTYKFVATNDKTGWKLMLPNRPVMDLNVTSMDNDSTVADVAPYSSVLRKNMKVSTHTNMHFDGNKVTGTTIAHYITKGADSVVNLRISGTKQ